MWILLGRSVCFKLLASFSASCSDVIFRKLTCLKNSLFRMLIPGSNCSNLPTFYQQVSTTYGPCRSIRPAKHAECDPFHFWFSTALASHRRWRLATWLLTSVLTQGVIFWCSPLSFTRRVGRIGREIVSLTSWWIPIWFNFQAKAAENDGGNATGIWGAGRTWNFSALKIAISWTVDFVWYPSLRHKLTQIR